MKRKLIKIILAVLTIAIVVPTVLVSSGCERELKEKDYESLGNLETTASQKIIYSPYIKDGETVLKRYRFRFSGVTGVYEFYDYYTGPYSEQTISKILVSVRIYTKPNKSKSAYSSASLTEQPKRYAYSLENGTTYYMEIQMSNTAKGKSGVYANIAFKRHDESKNIKNKYDTYEYYSLDLNRKISKKLYNSYIWRATEQKDYDLYNGMYSVNGKYTLYLNREDLYTLYFLLAHPDTKIEELSKKWYSAGEQEKKTWEKKIVDRIVYWANDILDEVAEDAAKLICKYLSAATPSVLVKFICLFDISARNKGEDFIEKVNKVCTATGTGDIVHYYHCGAIIDIDEFSNKSYYYAETYGETIYVKETRVTVTKWADERTNSNNKKIVGETAQPGVFEKVEDATFQSFKEWGAGYNLHLSFADIELF